MHYRLTMKELDVYIVEKLRINKDTKINNILPDNIKRELSKLIDEMLEYIGIGVDYTIKSIGGTKFLYVPVYFKESPLLNNIPSLRPKITNFLDKNINKYNFIKTYNIPPKPKSGYQVVFNLDYEKIK